MIFTVGHSNHAPERLLALLECHQVTAIADVRSRPYSRRFPAYNREPFKAWLRENGIAYVFLGQELGGRSSDPALFDESGRVDYKRLAETTDFQRGIERLRQGMEVYRIALLCAEKEPLECHRGLLVAPCLADLGVEVVHILADGSLEPHRQMEQRLLARYRLDDDLFGESRRQRLERAYRKRASEAAYRLPGTEKS